jgi:hypothetical protein
MGGTIPPAFHFSNIPGTLYYISFIIGNLPATNIRNQLGLLVKPEITFYYFFYKLIERNLNLNPEIVCTAILLKQGIF